LVLEKVRLCFARWSEIPDEPFLKMATGRSWMARVPASLNEILNFNGQSARIWLSIDGGAGFD
jgi:hypothetical protein